MASPSASIRSRRSRRWAWPASSDARGIHCAYGSSSGASMVFLNGEFLPIDEAKVPVLDRGFIFGDGVYELVPVYSRVPFRLDEHLARLERSLGETKIRNPYTRAQWRSHVYALIDAQSFEDQGVYFQVTRGAAKRDHAFPKGLEPTVFMMSNPLTNPPAAQVEQGGSAV